MGRDEMRMRCLTVWPHANSQTLGEATSLALVSAGHVDQAAAALLAPVLEIPANAALEESPAAVAAGHSVVLARSFVSANVARRPRPRPRVPLHPRPLPPPSNRYSRRATYFHQ